MKKKSITLIGMPASGKSTIGVILAKVLGYGFLDTDLLIQMRTGKRLPELIEQLGTDGFIRLEEDLICEVQPDDGHPTVIATGGSAVYGARAMAHLAEFGPVCYLQVSFETIESRLRNIRQRGVVLKPGQTLESLYDERCLLYEKYASWIVREGDRSIEEIVRELADWTENMKVERKHAEGPE